MSGRKRSSLQSVLDTYQYLAQGVTGRKAAPSDASQQLARDMIVPPALRQGMADALHRLPPTLTVAGLSSASVWVQERWYLGTMRDALLRTIEPADLLPIAFATDAESQSWHDYLYRYSAAKAVLVSHPPYALACVSNGLTPDPVAFPVAAARLGYVPIVPPLGTLSENPIATGRAFLVEDGQLVTQGGTVTEAIMLADIVERWCQVMTLRM